MIITLSGPAGAGKGTLAKMLADFLGLPHYDFGLIFRAIVAMQFQFTLLEVSNGRILFKGQDITDSLRTEEAGLKATRSYTKLASLAILLVRHANFVCDGRTCGTEIYPDADFKFYITASQEERMKRRGNNLVLLERDRLDARKDIVPGDAIVINTTGKSKEQCLEEMLNYEKHFVFCR